MKFVTKGYIKRIRIDIYNLEKMEVILGMPWLVMLKGYKRGIAHWDKQNNDVPAPNCMLKVRGEIIKVEGL